MCSLLFSPKGGGHSLKHLAVRSTLLAGRTQPKPQTVRTAWSLMRIHSMLIGNSCYLQFVSHKIYKVNHCVAPTSTANICAVHTSNPRGILFTTAEPHSFKSRRCCGQLDASEGHNVGVLAPILQTALKIVTVPTPLQFTVQSPIKGLPEAQLASLTAQLQAGTLQMTFR